MALAMHAGSFDFAQAGSRHAGKSEGLRDDALEDKESLASLFFGQVANEGQLVTFGPGSFSGAG